MDRKNRRFKQACYAQKISRYYYEIDYYQHKANRITNNLS